MKTDGIIAEPQTCPHGLLARSCQMCELTAENNRLKTALHSISLGSKNSGTTKEDLGKEARAALK